MRFRKLRIAWSVGWGLAAVLLILLWVRSYYWNDVQKIHVQGRKFAVQSVTGRVCFARGRNTVSFHQKIADDRLCKLVREGENVFGYRFRPDPHSTDFHLQLPHWWLVLIAATLAAAPWLPWRFSLRTLLIATALVAVVLGLVVWGSK